MSLRTPGSLINDRSLSDYHHEHPEPTNTPGEYVFRFTPAKPGPYRMWADVVPTDTGVQEYVTTDVPAQTTSLPLTDRDAVSRVVVTAAATRSALKRRDGPSGPA